MPACIWPYGIQRTDLAHWLGDQCAVLDLDPHVLFLVEVFAGESRLSKHLHSLGYWTVSIGYRYGHGLDNDFDRRCVLALVWYLKPQHVWVSWTCKYYCAYSRVHLARGGATRDAILAGRKRSLHYLQLFSQLFRMQYSQNLHCHGENPAGSAAWTQRPIVDLVRELGQAVQGPTVSVSGPACTA